MTAVWPLRFRDTSDGILFTAEAGGWFVADDPFLNRYATGSLTDRDLTFLKRKGFAFEREGDLAHSSYLRRWAGRHASRTRSIGYVILVPTLRCNLSCEYCQVSRAAENARGYDWTEETLANVLDFLDGLSTDSPKIEFQGGEPLLRIDLLEGVRSFCRERFEKPSFVVCTNMQTMTNAAWEFFDADDTFASTSIDGDIETHTRQRTFDTALTGRFLDNVAEFIDRFGNDRISALPTIDTNVPFDPDAIIDAYAAFGMQSIYLRPVNRQGFARRKPSTADEAGTWAEIHARFVHRLIERNFNEGAAFEEYYFTHALRRVLQTGIDSHVDLRNPNLLADGYIVVDHDGKLYPTDEARMISRVGQIDLAIGTIALGIDSARVQALNAWSFNDLDPDCQHCAFQPFCGTDVVDDVSRYGRIDLPRSETWFCQRHTALYDLVFELIRSSDPKVKHSLAIWVGVTRWPEGFNQVHR